MRKLLFKIEKNTVIVIEKNKTKVTNLNNTNVISTDEVLFSEDYIKNNEKIVGLFLSEITNTYFIDTIIITNIKDTLLVLNVLKNNDNITNLVIKDDEQLTFSIIEAIVKTNIKSVNCYNLQPFMIEYLDKYEVLVESRNEILFVSSFMLDNNLSTFSSLFYKMTLQVDIPMDPRDEEDFRAFCKINKYLKTVNVNMVNRSDLEFIVAILKKYNKKNVKIIIHENINDPELILYLRNFNKRKSKKLKIYFKLDYSKDYLKENLMKQTNNSILKYCGYLILFIIGFTFSYVFYDNYSSMQSIEKIQDNIKEVITLNDSEAIINNINKDKKEDEIVNINEDIASLFNINPEVVGWINVPGTNIDYPVVQTLDNEYYLNHNIYLEKDKNGWVFMDYRNDLTNILSDNVIIYAHNRYYSGVMFGTLQNTMRQSWYKNKDNHVITIKTLYEELHYRVFSLYKIAVTNDYMQTIFADDKQKISFLDMLKSRSLYNFDVNLDENSKILTLSTCADEDNRYVVHAVLEKN